MGVAQLAERSILTPEDPCFNPVCSNFYKEHLFTVNYIENTKLKEKRGLQ